MTDRDRRKKFAFVGIAVVVLLLASFFYRSPLRPAAPVVAPAAPAAVAVPASAASVAPPPRERLRFAADSDRLPAEAMDVLARIADAARADPAASVEISAFQGIGGAEAQLAGRRGEAVRHALEANGVPASRMRMNVLATPVGEDAKGPGRVELEVK
jgi:outer membrane protein OmpA-like peptidoglycan-associated protein